MNNETNKIPSRRKFLFRGLSMVTFFSVLNFALPSNKKKDVVKMLTRDGKLVEVDKYILDKIAKKQKATNREIFQWMNNPGKEKG